MKTRLYLSAIKCAAALVATVNLTACSSSDDVTDAPVNPTYDGKSVKTQFAINIANESSKTRMSDVNTQNSGNFLGMENIYLIPFVDVPAESKYTDGTSTGTNPQVSATYTFPSDVLKLSEIAANDIDNSTNNKNYKIYNDVSIPVGTKNFLFYGTGPMTDKAKNGALTVADISSTSGNTTDKIKFSLVDIATTDGNNTSLTTISEEFAAYLTTIANATGWNALTSNDDATLYQARTNLIANPSNGGVRGVSAAALKQIVQDIVTLAYPKQTPNGETGTTVSNVADAICNAVKAKYFEISDVVGSEGKVDWKSSGVDEVIKSFPRTLNIPEGAMLVTWDASNTKFVATATPSMGTTTGSSAFINFYNLTYPAAIAYRANTELAAKSEEVSSWPTQYTNWESSTWDDWGAEVLPTTRSIALKNNIQYGVAQLAATVIAASNLLNDNSENNKVSVTDNAFPVKGILIGGQKSDVNWEYLPNTSATDKVIYDSDINDIKLTTSESSPFYTLLFDSYVNGDKQAQNTIRIALELENNSGGDFKGIDGVVAAGQRFYLLAELDPKASGLAAISWPSTNPNRFPQFGIDRTFVQDFKTKVKFTVSTLKNAYVTIPDLRSVKLQLGLSVDLQWQNGLTFEVPLGGSDN
ncbi:MAG: hypothetical protein ACI3Y0_05630 [Prevotella sp.]